MTRYLLLILLTVSTLFSQEMEKTTISIPWSDFRTVLKELHQDTIRETVVPQIPAPYVISDAEYQGKQSGENEFTFTGDLEVTVLQDEWIEIELGRGVALYPGVKINNKPAQIGMKTDGTTFLMIRGKGTHQLSYRFMVTRAEASGQSSLSFPLPGQAVARLSLELDGEEYQVYANERALLAQKMNSGGYRYNGGLGTGNRAYIRWRQELSHGNGQEALVSGKLNTIYSIGMGVVSMQSQINLSVLHREIRQFSFSVPKNLDIIDLTGQAVATWETKDSGDTRVVTAYLKYNLTDMAPFLLNAELVYPDSLEKISLPAITLSGTSRQEGTIGVGVLSNVELTLDQFSNNVVQRDKRELPAWFSDQGDVLFVYQHLSGNYDISLKLKHHNNLPVLDALVRRASIRSLLRDDGKMITRYDMEVHNRGEQFIRCDWDEKWQLWSVYCNNQPARPAYDSLTGQLLVPLEKSSDQTAITNVRIVYLSSESQFDLWGKQQIRYPKVNMPMQEIAGALYVPEQIRKRNWKGTLRESRYFSPHASKSDALKKEEKVSQSAMAFDLNSAVQMQQTQGEAGLLSIPVNIDFDGQSLPFTKVMAKAEEELNLSFSYYQVPTPTPSWVSTLLFIITVIGSALFATALLKGFTRKTVVAIISIVTLTKVIALFYSCPVYWFLYITIPILLLIFVTAYKVMKGIHSLIKKRSENLFDDIEDTDDENEEYDDEE